MEWITGHWGYLVVSVTLVITLSLMIWGMVKAKVGIFMLFFALALEAVGAFGIIVASNTFSLILGIAGVCSGIVLLVLLVTRGTPKVDKNG